MALWRTDHPHRQGNVKPKDIRGRTFQQDQAAPPQEGEHVDPEKQPYKAALLSHEGEHKDGAAPPTEGEQIDKKKQEEQERLKKEQHLREQQLLREQQQREQQLQKEQQLQREQQPQPKVRGEEGRASPLRNRRFFLALQLFAICQQLVCVQCAVRRCEGRSAGVSYRWTVAWKSTRMFGLICTFGLWVGFGLRRDFGSTGSGLLR